MEEEKLLENIRKVWDLLCDPPKRKRNHGKLEEEEAQDYPRSDARNLPDKLSPGYPMPPAPKKK